MHPKGGYQWDLPEETQRWWDGEGRGEGGDDPGEPKHLGPETLALTEHHLELSLCSPQCMTLEGYVGLGEQVCMGLRSRFLVSE